MNGQWVLDRVADLWPASLAGTGLIVLFCVLGWQAAHDPRRLAVRIIAWWINRIVRPLLRSRSWVQCFLTIVLNNSLVCGVVIAAGVLGPVAWLGVAGLGLGLGGGMRLLLADPSRELSMAEPDHRNRPIVHLVGMLLNMLEIPAIMLSAGLALSQGAWAQTVTAGEAARLYGAVVVPLLVISAAGEALWMTSEDLG